MSFVSNSKKKQDKPKGLSKKAAKTSVASSEGETNFGPDDLFSQDATTPPTKPKKPPTFSSMMHKVYRTSSKASHSSREHQAPSSRETDSGCSDNPTSRNQSLGGDSQEGVVKVLHTPNSYLTLESCIEPSVEGSEGAAPQLEKVNNCH